MTDNKVLKALPGKYPDIYTLCDDGRIDKQARDLISKHLVNDLARENLDLAIAAAWEQIAAGKCQMHVLQYGRVNIWVVPISNSHARNARLNVSFINREVAELDGYEKLVHFHNNM